FVSGLEGKVAGVNVSGVATGPNGASNIIIRGITSLTGNSQPLYVLNNVILVNQNYATTDLGGYGGRDGGDGIGDINPDDIENISILKGSAATALYGYRGANGVVLITTKKGKNGKELGVEINSNYVLENVIDETDFQTTYGQGYNGAKPISPDDAYGSMESSWGAVMDGTLVPQFDGVSRPYSNVAKGNMQRFYREGQTATNTISLSKGFGEYGNTRFSASYLNDNSYVPNAGLQRLTFTQNTDLKLSKNLSLTLSGQYNSEYTKNAPYVSDAIGNLNWGPVFLPRNVNITTLAGANGNGTTANGHDELNPFGDLYTTNPYFAAYLLQGAVHRNRFIGSANLKYTFNNGLFFGVQANEDYSDDRNTSIEPEGTGYLVVEGVKGDMSEQNVKQGEFNIDATTGKNFKFSKDLSLNILLGYNYREFHQEFLNASGNTFAIDYLYTLQNLVYQFTSYGLNHQKNASVYGSADLAYKNYAYLTITGRNDWYSTLAPSSLKIHYLYPSVSGSFVFSELLHIPNMDIGRLRLSYAATGGEADDAYQTRQAYYVNGTLIYPNGTPYPIGQAGNGTVPNSGLEPSKTQEFEIGSEMDFFNNRLRTDIAFYHKNVIGDIVPVSIDLTSGYYSALLNVGNIRYNGVEFDFGGMPVKARNFSWDVDFNGSYAVGKVISLGGQPFVALGSTQGDWTSTGNSVANVQQIVGKAPSQIIVLTAARDKNGNIKIDPTTGAPKPGKSTAQDFGAAFDPWSGGITNTFRYKNFDLTFLIDGKFGGKLFSNTNFTAYVQGLSKETLERDPAGYGTDKIGASDYYGRLANANPSMFVYDASFIKFRSLNFGFNFPAKLFHGAVQGLRLSFVCHNVFTILKHTPNIDPETDYSASIYTQGLESPDVPYSRTIGFNLNVKF
ncbi:MAG: SusC/RagA family TonB-linked outer membrane protein, partial [Parafilimonas sp.]